MSVYRRYDDVAIGDVYPKDLLKFSITQEIVDSYRAAIGEPAGDDTNGVPSMIAAVYLIKLLEARRAPPGGIHAKQSVRFHRAPRLGETLSMQATVAEKYVRKERPYVVLEFVARGQGGDLVSTGRITTIWGREQ